MADGKPDIRLFLEHLHEAIAVWHFGGAGEHLDDVRIGQHLFRLHGQDIQFILRALLGRIDKGPFQMAAHDLGTLKFGGEAFFLQLADLAQHGFQQRPFFGQRGGQEGSDAVFQQALGHMADTVDIAVGGVGILIAVDMGIHQAGGYIQALGVNDFIRHFPGVGLIGNADNALIIQQRFSLYFRFGQQNPPVYDCFDHVKCTLLFARICLMMSL